MSEEKKSEEKSELPVGQVYRWWWLHDGRWYQEVVQRLGFEVANDINRQALKFVSSRVGRMVAGKLGRPIQECSWPEAVEAFCSCPRLMWPPEMIHFEHEITGPGTFEVTSHRNFALQMLQRAGTPLEKYDCPCLQMREGWFEGLGMKVVENRVLQCMKSGASSCRYAARVEGFGPEAGAGGETRPEK
jgi:hypothetical protein